ncbi:MAG: cyanophycinase, partial [Lewinella sp.]|nr:cyanophycinase [Lewinella sp.]
MKHYLFLLTLLGSAGLAAQSYTSYFSGNETDAQTQPQGGVCMMGGATEHDNAMRWFLQRADGGDVLVLRASGADGYNSYLYSELGETVNSVETIVFNNASAATEPYVQQAIQQAEAIWL